jgi:hypothetical protein
MVPCPSGRIGPAECLEGTCAHEGAVVGEGLNVLLYVRRALGEPWAREDVVAELLAAVEVAVELREPFTLDDGP